jgi:hypothetical protein
LACVVLEFACQGRDKPGHCQLQSGAVLGV